MRCHWLCQCFRVRCLPFLARSVIFEVALLAGSWPMSFPIRKIINRLALLPSPPRGRGAGGEGASLSAERSGETDPEYSLDFFARHLSCPSANWLLVRRFPCQSPRDWRARIGCNTLCPSPPTPLPGRGEGSQYVARTSRNSMAKPVLPVARCLSIYLRSRSNRRRFSAATRRTSFSRSSALARPRRNAKIFRCCSAFGRS